MQNNTADKDIRDVVVYIWDNYIEYVNSRKPPRLCGLYLSDFPRLAMSS